MKERFADVCLPGWPVAYVCQNCPYLFTVCTDDYRLAAFYRCVAVDAFQHIVYEQPELSPKQRKAEWRKLEQQFLPHKDYDGHAFLESGGFWQTQAHIYQSPFYYIDYTLAQMCAFQFWHKAQINKEAAFADYVKLCKAGGSKSFLELVEYAGLQSPFDAGMFSDTIKKIENYLSAVDDAVLNG